MKREPDRDAARRRAVRLSWSLRAPTPPRDAAVTPLLAGVVPVAPAGIKWYGRGERPGCWRAGELKAKG